jgi:hypothetical protein
MNQQITRAILWERPRRIQNPSLCDARRVWLLLRDTFGQGNVIRGTRGWIHYAFYVGLLDLFIGTTIVFFNDGFFNDGLAEATGVFGFPYYLAGMTEVL